MKKRLFILIAIMAVVMCLFAISASAATTNEFGTIETLEGIDLTNMSTDTTSRVVLFDGTEYHTYPANYIVTNAETLTLDFSRITSHTYKIDNIIRLEVPSGVTTIAGSAFQGKSSLVEIVLGNDVTTVGHSSFRSCGALTNVTIGPKMTSISNEAFRDSNKIARVDISDLAAWCGITFGGSNGANPVNRAVNKADCLYVNGILLTELVIPESVTEIKQYAFHCCQSITSVTIHDGVVKIGSSAFDSANKIVRVNAESLDAWWKISFANSTANPTYYAKDLYVDDAVVTSISTPTELTVLNGYNFVNCASITSITLHEGLTALGNGCFSGTGISKIDVPSTLTKLNDSVFENCKSLVVTTVPSHITYIGNYAFAGCTAITEFTIPESYGNNNYGNGILKGTSIKEIVIPSNITEVRSNTFQDCKLLEKVVLHENISTISGSVFQGCSALTDINLADTKIKTLGGSAFHSCTSLVAIQLPTTLTGFTNGNVFQDCTSLQFVDFGDNKNTFTIDIHFTFYNCSSLQAISLPAGTTKLGNGTFAKCTSLKAVYLGESMIQMTGNKSDSSGDAPTFANCANMYFVNEPFSVINEDGDFYTSETFNMPKKPDVYYFPSTLQIICGTHNRNSSHSMTADGHVTNYAADDLAFVGCTNLNKYLVLPEGFTGFDDISNTRNENQRGDTLPAGLFHGCGTAENPITIVFLGKIHRVGLQRDGGNTNYVTYMFANPANTGFDDTIIGTWYSTSNTNYRNQTEMYVIFCHAEGGAQKYLINFEGSSADAKTPVLKATLQEGLNASDLHVSSPRDAVLTKEATCIANAYGNRYCFCGYDLGEAQVEGTATGVHIFEKDNDCTTAHSCTSDPNCVEKIEALAHEIYETLVYVSFVANGDYCYGCSNVGCTVIDVEETRKPIFVAGEGFSTKLSVNDGISGGYVVNVEALNEYNRVNSESKLTFGVMMVNPKYLDGKESFFLNGQVNAEKYLQVDMSEANYTNLSITITGFVGDAKAVSLVIALYAYVDGEEVEFIQSQTTLCADAKVTLGDDTLYTVTYESVANPAGKDLSDLGDYIFPTKDEE